MSGNINPFEVSKKIYDKNVDSLILSKLFNYPLISDKKMVDDIKSSKIAIYTAFTGDYDQLKDPDFIDNNCDYICFTDNPDLESDVWSIKLMDDSLLDDNRKAKQYKVFPNKYLPDYDYSLWIDGTFKIIGSIREYIYKYINSPMLLVVHPERDCIFDEAESSIQFPRYSKYLIYKQVDYYRAQGMPKNYGLPSLGVIFRKHNNSKVMNLMNQWWEEIINFSNQDQLSLTYLMWKNKFHPSIAKEFIWINDYWTVDSDNFQHNKIIDDYITSQKIIDNLGKIGESNEFSKEEILLILNDICSLQSQCLDLNNIRDNLDNQINDLRDSNSWKLTRSLRRDGS